VEIPFEPMINPSGRDPDRGRKSGIYCIRCNYNGKVYIGSATYLAERKGDHRRALVKGKHENKYLQRAWNKYGKDEFVYAILEYCDIDSLVEREQYYLDAYQATNRNMGFNIFPYARSPRGYKQSEESKKKTGDAHRGKKMSDEARKHMSESKTGLKMNLTPEERERRRTHMLGKQWSLGRKLSEEHKNCLRGNKFALGHRKNEEQLNRLALAHITLTLQQCNQMREDFFNKTKTMVAIAAEYGKCVQTIGNIIHRRRRAYQ
jgi:group I intron endonuclease